MTTQTVTATTADESRAAIANIGIGTVVSCPRIYSGTFTVTERKAYAYGHVVLRLERSGASSSARLYANERDDKGGFWFEASIGSTPAKVTSFKIVA